LDIYQLRELQAINTLVFETLLPTIALFDINIAEKADKLLAAFK